jgi:predicted alpha/beta superfamily hydrolase
MTATEMEYEMQGTPQMLRQVWSPQLQAMSDLLICLPPSYETSDRRYPVIYMCDGQRLFERTPGFNEEALTAPGDGVEAIVVCVPHMGERRRGEGGRPSGHCAEPYLAFLADTVKPLVDASLRTLPERDYTGIVGASLGGLASLAAFFCRPEVFGFAGALSPALWHGPRGLFETIDASPYVLGQLYLDVGAGEPLDMLEDVRMLRLTLLRKGYHLDERLCYLEVPEAQHNAADWAARLPAALALLLARAEMAV